MRRVIVVTLALFVVVSALPHTESDAAPPDATHANQMIAALNAWRLEQGLWPLQPNDTLTALAQAQAEYLISLPDLPDDMHAGRRGETPMERAIQPPYNWPHYGRSDQVAIDEIAYVGRNVDAALRWWKGSSLHSRTVTNSAYREVGVGMVPHTFGMLYIVVFGARPNVLPVQADFGRGVLYLSNEEYRYAAGKVWLYRATQVRLFDAEGRPLSAGWQAWQAQLTLPQNTGDHVYLLFSDGKQQVLSDVTVREDYVLLPDTLDTVAALVAPQAPVAAPLSAGPATATPVASATPAPVVAVVPTRTPASAGTASVSSPTPTAAPSATAVPSSEPDVLLVYDSRSLAVINVTGAPLDISRLVLVHTNGRLPLTAWNTSWLSGSLMAIAARDCVQVWGWNEPGELAKPGQCRIQRGVITIDPNQRFWVSTDFSVLLGGTQLATCTIGVGECAVTLP